MTGVEIRQSFLDFFKSKQHTIVPSSSLMPDSPNLLFTNAGMNQFVPIFLGQIPCPYNPPRAADTQKCIRAGGKHNDLEDVGIDTYHHTFFEMLGNWSFGDYFKKEAIHWAWELLTEVWKFPKNRLYATVYKPAEGDPASFDQEAYDIWTEIFAKDGLDPKIHIKFGNKKDNFWMMGETGPCGPCSEIHIDLTESGDTKGELVNKGTALCIEIWNLVFMEFNANPDGTFSPLPAKNVDTGMGFERVTGIIQNTKNFSNFKKIVSNYETDIFRPIFEKLEQLSGKKYGSTLPHPDSLGNIIPATEQEKIDVAFRVIADHIRTLSFAIADGILPGNTDRNYVLRRILRRAVRYGRFLGFHTPFFYKLVGVISDTMGDVFPEVRNRRSHIEEVIALEEEAFNRTLDRGMEMFNEEIEKLPQGSRVIPGEFAFRLFDTYGFPLDLTQLMARERGFSVDTERFEKLMEEQRERARRAQKKEIIEISQVECQTPTNFVGYNQIEAEGHIIDVVKIKNKTAVILDVSPFYAEMGGQIGDTGEIIAGTDIWKVIDTQKAGDVYLHFINETSEPPSAGMTARLVVDKNRRAAIQRHHTVTHLLHWALHQIVSKDVAQKGSYVGNEKLTFDFNSQPLTPQQIEEIERLVNERIVENAPVSWVEVKYEHIKGRADIRQFFGEKYGEWVRVVQIGGRPTALDGYSMELCGGTHCRSTGEIGLFRIVNESAIAAGVRRIEAVAGLNAFELAKSERELLKKISLSVNSPVAELERKIESLVEQQKTLEKQLRALKQKEAANYAAELLKKATTINGIPAIIENLGACDANSIQEMVNNLKSRFSGVVVLGGVSDNAVSLIAAVSPEYTSKISAGKIIQTIAPIVGGRGGGKPDNARGGGKDVSKLNEALERARNFLKQ
ncbi:MAG: alanine--tRNA ligase [Verrucomicrobiia bacterium]